MCYFCIEIQKENLSALEITKLMQEIILAEDDKHLDELNKIIENTSKEYKEKLDGEANEQINLDDPDPFDPWF